MNKNKIFRPIEEEEEITSNKFRKTKDKFIKEKESSDKMSVITAKGAQQVTQNLSKIALNSQLEGEISDPTIRNHQEKSSPFKVKIKLKYIQQEAERRPHKIEHSKSYKQQFFSPNSAQIGPMLEQIKIQQVQIKNQLFQQQKTMKTTMNQLKSHKSQKILSTLRQVKEYKYKMTELQKEKDRILEEHQLSMESIL